MSQLKALLIFALFVLMITSIASVMTPSLRIRKSVISSDGCGYCPPPTVCCPTMFAAENEIQFVKMRERRPRKSYVCRSYGLDMIDRQCFS